LYLILVIIEINRNKLTPQSQKPDHNSDRYKRNDNISEELEIVDVNIIQDIQSIKNFRETWLKQKKLKTKRKEIGSFPLIEIKVRNKSNSIIFIKKVIFDADLIEAVPNSFSPMAFPVTWEYNVLLSSCMKKQVKELDVSQVVKPNGVDRFVIVVGRDGFNLHYIKYKTKIILQYNNNNAIDLGCFDIKIYGPIFFEPDRPAKIKHLPNKK